MSPTRGPRARPRPTLDAEQELFSRGAELVVGVDEVGRGSWAGPVSVGVACIDRRTAATGNPPGIRDSKAYSEGRRETAFEEAANWCVIWSVGSATSTECDELGMTAALREATRRALAEVVEKLGRVPDHILLDGSHNYLAGPRRVEADGAVDLTGNGAPPVTTLVKGDQSSLTIAAASVLAKVTRDRYMRSLDHHFPPFDFASNKGYPSPAHQIALAGFGPTAIHRTTWAFMDALPWLRAGILPSLRAER